MIRLLLSVLFLINFSVSQDGPIVETKSGSILGTVLTSRKGVDFYAFRKIPYAEPPIGELRFKVSLRTKRVVISLKLLSDSASNIFLKYLKPPVPIKPWDGIYNATLDGPVCSQPGGDDFSPKDEDCLFLNVYTRQVSIITTLLVGVSRASTSNNVRSNKP